MHPPSRATACKVETRSLYRNGSVRVVTALIQKSSFLPRSREVLLG